MHYAAEGGHEEMVELLLELGASYKPRDAKGRKPKDVARKCAAGAGAGARAPGCPGPGAQGAAARGSPRPAACPGAPAPLPAPHAPHPHPRHAPALHPRPRADRPPARPPAPARRYKQYSVVARLEEHSRAVRSEELGHSNGLLGRLVSRMGSRADLGGAGGRASTSGASLPETPTTAVSESGRVRSSFSFRRK
jgi:hypothetical protein